MYRRNRHRRTHGQALVEYALILALVALVALAAASVLGSALQRIYGLTAGALGVKHDSTGVIEIYSALCIADKNHTDANGNPDPQTGLVVTGFTTENLNDLTGNITGSTYPILTGNKNFEPNSADTHTGSFIFHPALSLTSADTTVCPLSIVIQAPDKAIAIAPVESTVYE